MRSERNAAGFLLIAAALGLILANTGAGRLMLEAKESHLGVPALGLDLSIGHWISDGLLAIFFFIVAVELKHEFTSGSLNSVGKAFVPAFAALGGIAVPAGIFLLFTAGTDVSNGWPIPTATDIAFALGVLAMFGRGLPGRLRIFLLALAVLDDLVAILIIAIFFTSDINWLFIAASVVSIAAFGLLSRRAKKHTSPIVVIGLIVLGLVSVYFVYVSGIHATIAGVALGLVMAGRPGARAAHVLEPYSNGIVLPLFAFSAALVAIPGVGIAQLSPAFWGIVVALPVGKLLGITALGWLGQRLVAGRALPGATKSLAIPDLVTVGMLGGIGFTVSLLMNELAFVGNNEIIDEGTLAVLLGSGISIVGAVVIVSLRARHYRHLKPVKK